MRKLFVFALVALLVLPGAVFAQRTATQNQKAQLFSLTVQANVKGAQVYVDGALIKGDTTAVSPGNHQVQVKADGYQDFATVVQVKGNTTLPVSLQPMQAQLTVQANMPGVAIFIDNNRINGNMALVSIGSHQVKVTLFGFLDFVATVNVSGNMTLPVALQAMNYQLTIQPNVKNAQLYVDNAPVKGFVATVQGGQHQVQVSAPGYVDFVTNVQVSGNMTLPVTLQALQFQLNVQSNVKGAQVLVNNGTMGNTPLAVSLQPGTYTVTVQAPGYTSYTETLNLDGPKTVNANLQPAMAGWQVQIPAANINVDVKGGHWSQIQVWIDGALQKGANAGQVGPGKHLFKITSGGMQVEVFVVFEAGRNYVIEPMLTMSVK